MKKSNRIGMELFNEELKSLINASAKIFPLTQTEVDANSNPQAYEYGRVGNKIYRWDSSKWSFIVADDEDIDWSEIKNKPVTFSPSEHDHELLHEHSNRTLLDSFTQLLIDSWNGAVSHVSDAVKHVTSSERTLWNTVTDKAEEVHSHDYSPTVHNHDDSYYTLDEVDTLLTGKSNNTHNHDGAYYLKSEVDGQLLNKSGTDHGHDDLHNHENKTIIDKIVETEPQASYDISELKYISDIKNGYTEGHSHANLGILQSITQVLIDTWNSAVSHITDTISHITGEERTTWNTVTGKAESVHGHEMSDITGLSLDWSGIDNKPLAFNPEIHSHDDLYYTEQEVDGKLSFKVDGTTLSGHTGNSTIHVTQTDKDKLHEHTNKLVLDKFSEVEGVPQYNGEDIGGGSSGAYIIKREEFTATEGQTVFNLTLGSYTQYSNRLSIYIWGAKQYNNAFDETSETSFTMVEGLNYPDRVVAEWIETVDIEGLYQGHASTHMTGGGDEIPMPEEVVVSSIGTVKPTNGATMWYQEV